jgi:hypothetical protein
MQASLVDTQLSSRELVRTLRCTQKVDGCLPESVAWQAFVELHKRGERDAPRLFIGSLRSLHRRRCIPNMDLPVEDGVADEHKLVEDLFLANLWKAYKRCIRDKRTGPADRLLKDIEERLSEI